MTFANQLTVARIVAVVPVMLAVYVPFPGNRYAVLAIYVAAILTDYFDGVLARSKGEVTAFGKLMDSVADKALIVSLFFVLVGEGLMGSWMAAIMVVREFAVTGLRMVALESGEVIAANNWGKAKMNAQALAVFLLLLGYAGVGGGVMLTVGWWVMLAAVVLTIFSGWSYLRDTPRILAATAGEDRREPPGRPSGGPS